MNVRKVLSDIEAAESLGNMIHVFYECVTLGFNDYFRFHEGRLHIYRKTTKANIIFDLIIDHLKRKLVTNPDIRFVNRKSFISLLFRDQLLIKFKKLKKNRRSDNVKTKQNDQFVNQEKLFDLPEGVTHIEVGYILNETGNEITGIHIVCPEDEKSNYWEINVEEFLEKERPVNLFTPISIPQKENRFKIKGKENEKPEETDENRKAN